jgi:hypothetical protein
MGIRQRSRQSAARGSYAHVISQVTKDDYSQTYDLNADSYKD